MNVHSRVVNFHSIRYTKLPRRFQTTPRVCVCVWLPNNNFAKHSKPVLKSMLTWFMHLDDRPIYTASFSISYFSWLYLMKVEKWISFFKCQSLSLRLHTFLNCMSQHMHIPKSHVTMHGHSQTLLLQLSKWRVQMLTTYPITIKMVLKITSFNVRKLSSWKCLNETGHSILILYHGSDRTITQGSSLSPGKSLLMLMISRRLSYFYQATQ